MKYLLLLSLLLSFSAYSDELFDETLELAQKGDAAAQYNLAWMYDNGEGVSENDAEAIKWYQKAAEQGDADAQSNLGVMYANGEGVPENKIKAYLWYSLAKAQGNENAKHNLEILKGDMTKEQIAKAQELASKCWESEFKGCD